MNKKGLSFNGTYENENAKKIFQVLQQNYNKKLQEKYKDGQEWDINIDGLDITVLVTKEDNKKLLELCK
ncbi:hypothetical protein [Peptostreptococcus equinus]|uniref:Uncharacterized protein n=1 Tax=Peptostreptococcus equinus TaxID=3003601 RepID=A0ABY7JT85_9FIRM|nr:hypothetical protein [Peptostreptococcus sp. CBA3647]WAW15273.1 hypothetical protein O0R46_02140 [Peptostreptococcus sp. CBA3647]